VAKHKMAVAQLLEQSLLLVVAVVVRRMQMVAV
jgi:hypothetical protein